MTSRVLNRIITVLVNGVDNLAGTFEDSDG